MLYYLCHPGHAYTMAVLRLYYGRPLRRFLRLVPMGRAATLRDAAPGTVIWTDLDRLAPAELAAAGAERRYLLERRPDLAHLNDPDASLQRFDLLRRLHALGLNDFAVRRPGEALEGLRYPVFLRDEVGAAHAPPALLETRAALEAALHRLPALGFARPMIVEFGARPGADGCYRKYGAFRVGERIYAQHCFIEPGWFVKHGRPLSGAQGQEFADYITRNPHAALLRPIFDAAKIEYGRIDYTLVEGRIQVFEINTNPAVLSNPPTPFDSFRERILAEPHVAALLALPGARVAGRHPALDRRHARALRPLRRQYRRLRWRLTLKGAARRLGLAARRP